jgi:hypothetical protein
MHLCSDPRDFPSQVPSTFTVENSGKFFSAAYCARPPKVLLIGAMGGTGRREVRKLLERGHEVTAWARRLSAVAEAGRSERLHVVTGEARGAGSIESVVVGY